MSELFIILLLVGFYSLLVGSFYPFMIALLVFVLGGALHAFAIDFFHWVSKTNNNSPKSLDKQPHHHV